jgi:Uma2 family endonuclease
VKEYWIVLGNQRQVEVYRRLQNGRYSETFVAGAKDALACLSIPGLRLQATEIFP